MYLYADTETFSSIGTNAGVHRYSEEGEVMLFAWALDEGDVHVWDRTDGSPMPELLELALEDDDTTVVFHNSPFDRTMLRNCMGIDLPVERIHDTMIQAFAHGLPGKLGRLCEVLRVPVDKAKDQAGKNLIQLFCKPRPKNAKIRRATRETHPAEWAKFVEYARLDVEAMRECMKRMPKVNLIEAERKLWYLDQKINDRGIQVDRELVRRALRAVEIEQKRLKDQTLLETGAQLESTTKRDAMLDFLLEEYGIVLPDLKMATIEKVLDRGDVPGPMAELLRIRLQATSTSTAKFKALERATSSDDRIRGLLQFDGAGRTGRWAGRLVQPQNFARGTIHGAVLEAYIDALLEGELDLIRLPKHNTMDVLSSALRGSFIAAPRRKLGVVDLSNIEGRAQAWLAGEEWKLSAFRAYDHIIGVDAKGEPIREGHDLYVLAYARAFGLDPDEVDKARRQVGKVMELALGYAGGVGAFVAMALGYKVDLDAMAIQVLVTADADIVEEAERFYDWTVKQKRSTFGLKRNTFVACEVLKRAWRRAHPEIASHWEELNTAAISAVLHPGEKFTARRLRFMFKANWLFMTLPSGRSLCYPGARVVDGQLTYMGVNQWTHKWERIKTHGGKLFENACQAVARDIMAANMQPIEDAGYPIVLSVHDELLTEPEDRPEFNIPTLAALLAAQPAWAPDIPLAAAGFEAHRYKKE